MGKLYLNSCALIPHLIVNYNFPNTNASMIHTILKCLVQPSFMWTVLTCNYTSKSNINHMFKFTYLPISFLRPPTRHLDITFIHRTPKGRRKLGTIIFIEFLQYKGIWWCIWEPFFESIDYRITWIYRIFKPLTTKTKNKIKHKVTIQYRLSSLSVIHELAKGGWLKNRECVLSFHLLRE